MGVAPWWLNISIIFGLIIGLMWIARCWRKYDRRKYGRRNRTLAHLAANVLLLLCHLHGTSLLAVESLKTLKTAGRGRGVRGRWRN